MSIHVNQKRKQYFICYKVVDEEGKSAKVVVDDNQLSLAIGKEGQNVRLAAKLTGWKIDIKSTSQAGAEEVGVSEVEQEVTE